ncbi:MAG: hypothetical protein ACM3TN_05275 [Alphaproteobacteria bacterium]
MTRGISGGRGHIVPVAASVVRYAAALEERTEDSGEKLPAQKKERARNSVFYHGQINMMSLIGHCAAQGRENDGI